jgi:hypothetical protein
MRLYCVVSHHISKLSDFNIKTKVQILKDTDDTLVTKYSYLNFHFHNMQAYLSQEKGKSMQPCHIINNKILLSCISILDCHVQHCVLIESPSIKNCGTSHK